MLVGVTKDEFIRTESALQDLLGMYSISNSASFTPLWCRASRRLTTRLGETRTIEISIGGSVESDVEPRVGSSSYWNVRFRYDEREHIVQGSGPLSALFHAAWLLRVVESTHVAVGFPDLSDVDLAQCAFPIDFTSSECDPMASESIGGRTITFGLLRERPGLVRWYFSVLGGREYRSVGVDDWDAVRAAWIWWSDVFHRAPL